MLYMVQILGKWSQVNHHANIALGVNAGYSLSTGDQNFLVGVSAGYKLVAGSYNVAIGNENYHVPPHRVIILPFLGKCSKKCYYRRS